MNDSQKMLVSRTLLLLNKGFENMSLEKQAEVMQDVFGKVKKQIELKYNLEHFKKEHPRAVAEADRAEAKRKTDAEVARKAEEKKKAEAAKAEANMIAQQAQEAAQAIEETQIPPPTSEPTPETTSEQSTQ